MDKLNQWVIDSGRTDQFIYDPKNLQDIKPCSGAPVKLPNGDAVSISCSGSTKLTPQLSLQDVLYVPSFNSTYFQLVKLQRHFIVL